jgi:hypothetical protein
MGAGDKGFQNGLQGNVPFSQARFPVLEVNPAFVETIQHPDAWNGVLRTLSLVE